MMDPDIWKKFFCDDDRESELKESETYTDDRSELLEQPMHGSRSLAYKNLIRLLGMIPWYTSGFQ